MNYVAGRRASTILSSRLSRKSPSISRRHIFTIIEQGKEGWRLTLGRSPVQLSPGLHWSIPILHSIHRVDLRESSLAITDLPGYTSDNVPVTCSGSLFYRITDGYKACFSVSDVEENVRRTGASAMRSVLGTFSYDQVIADRNKLNEKLNIVIGDSIASWGVICTRFEVQTFKPANREVERQLELQMEAERNRRKQLLDTQAQVNVAEGHKQRVILESEGHLQAKTNEADATYKFIVKEAEARQEQAVMQANALSTQVEAIASALSPSPGPQERQMALRTLVELRRLEQLRAIAESKNNSTYFFGDRSALGLTQDEYSIDYAEHIKSSLKKGPERRGIVDGAAPIVTN